MYWFGAFFLAYVVSAFPLALVFKKAEQTAWAAFVPVYNVIVLLETVGRPVWWIVLLLVPIVNVVAIVMVMYDLARSFGHGGGLTVALVLVTFFALCYLGFGQAQYRGPAAAPQS
jgi:hypothetical protein